MFQVRLIFCTSEYLCYQKSHFCVDRPLHGLGLRTNLASSPRFRRRKLHKKTLGIFSQNVWEILLIRMKCIFPYFEKALKHLFLQQSLSYYDQNRFSSIYWQRFPDPHAYAEHVRQDCLSPTSLQISPQAPYFCNAPTPMFCRRRRRRGKFLGYFCKFFFHL